MELQTYKGWSVDYRLREFRQTAVQGDDPVLMTMEFDSDGGDDLLTEMIVNGLVPQDRLSNLF